MYPEKSYFAVCTHRPTNYLLVNRNQRNKRESKVEFAKIEALFVMIESKFVKIEAKFVFNSAWSRQTQYNLAKLSLNLTNST